MSIAAPPTTAPKRSYLRLFGFGLLWITAAAFPVYFVFALVLPAWNTETTFLTGVQHERSRLAPAPRRGERVIVAVLDGVGYRRLATGDTFAFFRAEGSLRPIRTRFPTYTAPSITSLMTGVAPEDSGIRLNGGEDGGVVGLEGIAASAWSTGTYVRVRSRTYRPFEALARPPPGASVEPGRIRFQSDLAVMSTVPRPSNETSRASELTVVHLGEVDEAGHANGADSPAYADALVHAAAHLRDVVEHLDPTRDVLIVASDHGHRGARGHGGVEPEVVEAFFYAWGNGIRRGAVLDERPMVDVTSTIAVVAGVPTPSSNTGRPMLDVFDTDDAGRARMLAEPFDQASRWLCTLGGHACPEADAIAARLADGDASALAPAHAALDASSARFEATKSEARARGDRTRRIFGVLGTVVPLVLMVRLRPRPGALVAVAGAFLLAYVAVLLFKGYRPSLSAMTPTDLFLPDALKATFLALLPSAALAWRVRFGLAEAAALLLLPFVILVPIWTLLGADPRLVGGPVVSTLTFQLSPIGPGAALAALGALGAAAARRRFEARRRTSG